MFLDIVSLCRKDDLKKITFSHFLVFCTVWVFFYVALHKKSEGVKSQELKN